jgi:hypothetical protein
VTAEYAEHAENFGKIMKGKIIKTGSIKAAIKAAMRVLLLLPIAYSLWPIASHAQITYVTITVTNVSTNGCLLTVNGDARTATNNLNGNPGSLWQATNSVPWTATNLYRHLALHKFAGPVSVRMTGSNVLELIGATGQALTYSVDGFWATIAGTEVSTTTGYTVRLPAELYSLQTRTNYADMLIAWISTYGGTQAVAELSQALSNFVGKVAVQTVSGKTFINSTNVGGVSSNQWLRYARISNEGTGAPSTNYGLAFSAWESNAPAARIIADNIGYPSLVDANGNSLDTSADPDDRWLLNWLSARSIFPNRTTQFGVYENTWATSNNFLGPLRIASADVTNANVRGGGMTNVTGAFSSVAATNLIVPGTGAALLTNFSGQADALLATNLVALNALLSNAYVTAISAVISNLTLPGLEQSKLTNIVAAIANATVTNIVVLAGQLTNIDAAIRSAIATNLAVLSGALSNVTFGATYGTMTNAYLPNVWGRVDWRGDLAFPRLDFTTLGSSNNISVDLGTNVFVRLDPGSLENSPTICGLVGGRDGKMYWVFNDTGYAVTWSPTTVDPVTWNRIVTVDGGDVVQLDQGWAQLVYDAEIARWRIAFVYPELVAGASSALGALNDVTILAPAAGELLTYAGSGVWTNLMAWKNDRNNVWAWGAVTNDGLDDTAAFANCISNAVGPVYVPEGRYHVSMITLSSSNRIIGAGRAKTLIHVSGTNGIRLEGQNWYVNIEHLSLFGPGTTNSIGMNFANNGGANGPYHVVVEDAYIDNFWIGIRLLDTFLATIRDVRCHDNLWCSILSEAPNVSTTVKLEKVHVGSAPFGFLNTGGLTDLKLADCAIERAGGTDNAIQGTNVVVGPVQNAVIDNLYSEDVTTNTNKVGLDVTAATGVTIKGGRMSNLSRGIQINSATNISISGVSFNSTKAGGCPIYVTGGTACRSVEIRNNNFDKEAIIDVLCDSIVTANVISVPGNTRVGTVSQDRINRYQLFTGGASGDFSSFGGGAGVGRVENLVRESGYLTNSARWPVTRASLSVATNVPPIGSGNVYKLTEDGTAGASHFMSGTAVGSLSNTAYTGSIFIKTVERYGSLQLVAKDGATTSTLYFYGTNIIRLSGPHLNFGADTNGLADGWVRLWVAFSSGEGGSEVVMRVLLTTVDEEWAYDGDGSSSVLVCKPQLAVGNHPIGYVETVDAVVSARYGLVSGGEILTNATGATPFSMGVKTNIYTTNVFGQAVVATYFRFQNTLTDSANKNVRFALDGYTNANDYIYLNAQTYEADAYLDFGTSIGDIAPSIYRFYVSSNVTSTGVEKMKLNKTGLGIFTNNPAVPLHVRGTGTNAGAVRIDNCDTNPPADGSTVKGYLGIYVDGVLYKVELKQ